VEGVVETITAAGTVATARDLTGSRPLLRPSSAGLTLVVPRLGDSSARRRQTSTYGSSHPDHEALVEVLVDLGVECVDHGGRLCPRFAQPRPPANRCTHALRRPDPCAFCLRDDERGVRCRARRMRSRLPGLSRSPFALATPQWNDCIWPIQCAKFVTRRAGRPRARANISSDFQLVKTALG